MNQEIRHIPILPLRGITVFPGMVIHFDVGRDKSLKAIEEAMKQDEMIMVITQKDAGVDAPSQSDLYEIGTIVHITQIVKIKETQIRLLVKGEMRAKILSIEEGPMLHGDVAVIEEEPFIMDDEHEAMLRTVGELFEKYAGLSARISEEMVHGILSIDHAEEVMDIIIANIPLEVEKKQQVLETLDLKQRMYHVMTILTSEIQILSMQKNIYTKVKKNIDQSQKEYFLREQIKIIQEELGDKDSVQADVQLYEKRLKDLDAPEEVKQKIQKEIKKLIKTSSHSPESGTIRTYIENVLDVPWGKKTQEIIDLKKVNTILEKEHYGLSKVKERIMEYAAVKKITQKIQSPILCLVGPPGVGKTSIAQSIAHAVGRNYVRISLGGIRDESEIRGHRRTYVGSIPGRFVYGLTQAKSMNPLMLLDEIDKMMGDFRGDPAAALLEILDSSQNHQFRDNYLEIPLDLSEVMFVATANSLAGIPRPLLDRMEIIEINSYNENEKYQIAKKYLLPKELDKHGLTSSNLKISEVNLRYMIANYTKESGVRQLQRVLAKICRRTVREMVEKGVAVIRITPHKLNEYLGVPIYSYQAKSEEPEIGVVRGLAWTSVGGDTLSIEVNMMKGKGQLELTGQMGNVMKESAKAAVSYIRSKAQILHIDESFYKTCDIHIHIPEGAVPKDGPSAGITMATAMISALTQKAVKADIAMTGEITIRGRVLAIGGLKEKLLAAKRAHIYTIIVPRQNEQTVQDMESNITEGLDIIYAATMDEVLQHVFV